MITLGSDPELFCVTEDVDVLGKLGYPELAGTVIPGYYALGVVDPLKPDIDLPFGKIRPDGLAVEFTLDPSDNVAELVDRMRANIQSTAELVDRVVRGRLTVEPRAFVHQKWIDSLPESFGPACSLQVLGCSPDFSVYNIDPPAKPDPKTYNYRTSGGHIHVGVGSQIATDFAARAFITAALDTAIGTAGTFLSTSEAARLRKQMYGQPGVIRASAERGTIEYRSLTAQALVQTPELCEMIFTLTQRVVQYLVDVFNNAPSQMAAIEEYRKLIGDYDYLVTHVVPAIMDHDIEECRSLQATFALRTPAEMDVKGLIADIQHYDMPTTFELRGW